MLPSRTSIPALLFLFLLCSLPGTNSVNVVTLGSIEIFNAHEWFPSKPTVYFHCHEEENKTVLPDVKKAHVLYTFKGEESWQPLTEIPNKKCKRCGFYEKDTFKSDDVFDEWEFCPTDFIDGKYVRFKEDEFNATFFCPHCTASAADSDKEQTQNTANKKHNKRNLVFIVMISALASLVVMVGIVSAYKYWQKRKIEQDQVRFLKLFEEDDDIEDELGLYPVL